MTPRDAKTQLACRGIFVRLTDLSARTNGEIADVAAWSKRRDRAAPPDWLIRLFIEPQPAGVEREPGEEG